MDITKIAEDFERDGVVRVPRLISVEKAQEIRDEIDRYVREKLATLPGPDYVLEKDGKSVRNLWRLETHDAYFRALQDNPDILKIVATLVHGEPVCQGVETFNKPARVGSAVPYHQDNAYFCQNPPHMLTVWIALDPVTVANGAVYYVKGSHRTLLPHAPSLVQGNSIGLAAPLDVPKSEQFCGTLNVGDALFHHCQVVHHSDPNTTDQPRRGLLIVYHGSHTKTDPKLQEAYHKALALVTPDSHVLKQK
ncbi:MAG: phytanoyl-CoA dioxygenase family protein [Planctomycetes bacterium]|nr:phytanoyl-CoA dioxygenase family protein [Planctomycetota bacterium]